MELHRVLPVGSCWSFLLLVHKNHLLVRVLQGQAAWSWLQAQLVAFRCSVLVSEVIILQFPSIVLPLGFGTGVFCKGI